MPSKQQQLTEKAECQKSVAASQQRSELPEYYIPMPKRDFGGFLQK
jgi:hypothetical protein